MKGLNSQIEFLIKNISTIVEIVFRGTYLTEQNIIINVNTCITSNGIKTYIQLA